MIDKTTISIERATSLALKQTQIKLEIETGEKFTLDELVTILLNNFHGVKE